MKVKILDKKRLLDDFFIVDDIRLQHETFDGGWTPTVRRLNLKRGEAVAVLIYLKDKDAFVIIRQFRYAVCESGGDGWIEEIVAGVVDSEEPLDCARRECIEEAGYEIDEFDFMGTVYSSPGITTERVHMYLGLTRSPQKKHPGGGLDEEHEDIQIVELSREEAWQRLKNRSFKDGKTILALQYFFMNYPAGQILPGNK